MSPTQLPEGAITSGIMDTPSLSVVVDGRVIDEWGWCDVSSVQDAGYSQIYNAEVTVGTPFKFYHEVFLPSTVTGDIEMVILGAHTQGGGTSYEPTFITLP